MQKVILYYKFVPVPDPVTVMHWQRELCERHGLKGRIIIAEHGINGTLGGSIDDVKAYVRAMNRHPLFKEIDFKWSDGTGEDFPKLSVKVRKELVTLEPDAKFDPFDRGRPLKPKAWKQFIKDNPDAVIFDGRNEYESEIGKFKGAVAPKIQAFRDIKNHVKKLPKDKPLLTYCTGDIRCEYLSAYMKSQGFEDVYHLDGGIVRYGDTFGDDDLWEGKCFVFDNRMNVAFSSDSKDIASCVNCGESTSRQVNCSNLACHSLIVLCDNCGQTTHCPNCQLQTA